MAKRALVGPNPTAAPSGRSYAAPGDVARVLPLTGRYRSHDHEDEHEPPECEPPDAPAELGFSPIDTLPLQPRRKVDSIRP